MQRAARDLAYPDEHIHRTSDDAATSEMPDEAVEPERPRRAHLFRDRVLALIVLGAAASRFWALGSPSFWFDEYITNQVVRVRLLDLWSTVQNSEGSPPLYFLLEWGWVRAFGRGDAAMRSSSALAGTLTVVVMYAALIEFRQSRRAARLAAVLIAVNPLLIWYSREARAYGLFTFLCACTVLCLARALGRRRPIDYLIWSCVAAAAFATHYFGAFVIAPQGAWMLATMWKDRRWRDALYAFVPITVAGVGLTLMALGQRSTRQNWIPDIPLSLRLSEAGRSFVVGASQPTDILLIVAIPPLVYAAVAAVRWTGRRERVLSATMLAVAAACFVLSVSVGRTYFLGRNSIGIVILLTVPVAIGLAGDRARLGRVAAVILCGLWLVVTVWVGTDPELQKPDWKALAAEIDREVDSDDRVLVIGMMALPMHRYGLAGSRPVNPGETVTVQEIDVVKHVPGPRRCARWIGLTCGIVFWPPDFPPDVQQQFKYVGKFRVDNFQVDRYRSAEPVQMQPCRLVTSPNCLVVLHSNG